MRGRHAGCYLGLTGDHRFGELRVIYQLEVETIPTNRPVVRRDEPDAVFPPADQLWAWAHVHVNRDLVQVDGTIRSTDTDLTRARLEAVLNANPDHAYSRIICPRRLEPDVGYHAFLIPSFETGRLAGEE